MCQLKTLIRIKWMTTAPLLCCYSLGRLVLGELLREHLLWGNAWIIAINARGARLEYRCHAAFVMFTMHLFVLLIVCIVQVNNNTQHPGRGEPVKDDDPGPPLWFGAGAKNNEVTVVTSPVTTRSKQAFSLGVLFTLMTRIAVLLLWNQLLVKRLNKRPAPRDRGSVVMVFKMRTREREFVWIWRIIAGCCNFNTVLTPV